MLAIDDVASEEQTLRSKAAIRSWLCPGAGYALVGKGALAIATFLASICILAAVGWLIFEPSSASFAALGLATLAASGLWLMEQLTIRKCSLRPPGPAFLVRGYIPACGLLWAATIVCLSYCATSFGSLRMAGSGMAPTIQSGERMIYQKRVEVAELRPGRIIVYRNSSDSGWGEPGWIIVCRILAGPGDRLSIEAGEYYVNDEVGPEAAPLERYSSVVDVPTRPDSITVPEKCYFVVQDDALGSLDSRVLNWVRYDRILSTSLWLTSSRGMFRSID